MKNSNILKFLLWKNRYTISDLNTSTLTIKHYVMHLPLGLLALVSYTKSIQHTLEKHFLLIWPSMIFVLAQPTWNKFSKHLTLQCILDLEVCLKYIHTVYT